MKKCVVFIAIVLFFGMTVILSAKNDHLYIKLANDKNLSVDERLDILDSLLVRDPNNRDYLIRKWDLAMRNSRFKRGNEALSALYNLHYDSLDVQYKCYLLRSYSDALMVAGRYDKSIQVSLQMLRLQKPDSLKVFDFMAYMSLADINLTLQKDKSLERDLELMERCYASLKKQRLLTPSYDRECRIILLKARINQSKFSHNWDSLAVQADRLLEIATQPNDTIMALTSKADVYKGIGRYDLAEKLYKEMLESSSISYGKSTAVENYMALLFDQKRYRDVLEVANRYLPEMEGNTVVPVLTSVKYLEAMSLAELGRYEEADSIYREIIDYQRDRNIFTEGFISEDLANYRLEEKLMENVENEMIVRKMKGWLVAITILLVLAMGAGTVSWVLFRRNRRLYILRNQKIEEELRQIESTRRELTSTSLELLNQSEMVSRLEEILKDTKMAPDVKLGSIKSILINTEASKVTWDTFRNYFDASHKGFFDRLYKLHPNLTENDVKICAYMMLNFTTKEIAAMTQRSVRTLDTIKYRLHKKLNLPDGVSTLQYLRNLSATKD